MKSGRGTNRRTFLGATAMGASALIVAPAVLRGVSPTADPVRVGHIGTGTRGWDLIKYTGATDSAKVVAVCDVYKPHLQRGVKAAGNPDVKTYLDYRDLLADPKVEAVVIATPDHWHEQMLIDASNAGKAVYCEKGWTRSIAAAKRMREVIRKNKTVMQLGHQGRQYPASAVAGKMIREGKLGPVTLVKTGRYFNTSPDNPVWRWYGYYNWCVRPDPKQVLKDLDWQKWLGASPKIDFNERHFWHWRCYWPYGTGQAGDLLSHEIGLRPIRFEVRHSRYLCVRRVECLLERRPRSTGYLDCNLSVRKTRMHDHLRRRPELQSGTDAGVLRAGCENGVQFHRAGRQPV